MNKKALQNKSISTPLFCTVLIACYIKHFTPIVTILTIATIYPQDGSSSNASSTIVYTPKRSVTPTLLHSLNPPPHSKLLRLLHIIVRPLGTVHIHLGLDAICQDSGQLGYHPVVILQGGLHLRHLGRG